jgi:hypothetical protein
MDVAESYYFPDTSRTSFSEMHLTCIALRAFHNKILYLALLPLSEVGRYKRRGMGIMTMKSAAAPEYKISTVFEMAQNGCTVGEGQLIEICIRHPGAVQEGTQPYINSDFLFFKPV